MEQKMMRGKKEDEKRVKSVKRMELSVSLLLLLMFPDATAAAAAETASSRYRMSHTQRDTRVSRFLANDCDSPSTHYLTPFLKGSAARLANPRRQLPLSVSCLLEVFLAREVSCLLAALVSFPLALCLDLLSYRDSSLSSKVEVIGANI